jgi:NADH-quinone oxidoreductase subunit E
MKGKDAIIETLEDMLKIKIGETTSDGKFSLLQANCLGWCHKGPVMLINMMRFSRRLQLRRLLRLSADT